MTNEEASRGGAGAKDVGSPVPRPAPVPSSAPGGSSQPTPSWIKSIGDSLKAQAATWFAGFVISILAVFSSTITEYIKTALNNADLRTKYYEEFATNLSEFVFDAEVIVEFIDKGWTDAKAMTPLVKKYNKSIDNVRKKEYVYLS